MKTGALAKSVESYSSRLQRRITLLRLFISITPVLFVLQIVLALASAASTLMMVVATGRVVQAASRIDGANPELFGSRLLPSIVLLALAFVASQLLEPVQVILNHHSSEKVDGEIQRRVMDATSSPAGIRHLEDPTMLNRIAVAQGLVGRTTPGRAVGSLIGALGADVRALAMAWLIGTRLNWYVALLLVVGVTMVRNLGRSAILRSWGVRIQGTESFRRAGYHRALGMGAEAAKEMRIFRLVDWVKARFHEHWRESVEESWRERSRASWSMTLRGTPIWVAMSFTAFALIGSEGLSTGRIDDVAVLAQAVAALLALPSQVFIADSMLELGTAVLPELGTLERDLRAEQLASTGDLDPVGLPKGQIAFEGVSFRYPSSQTWILKGVDLVIPAGQSLAIVGENGSGKTTMVKLLARMYDPEGGRIAVDGTDLREFDPVKWQGQVAAIFQDFVRYELSLADNVGFGAGGAVPDAVSLEEALTRAGGAELLKELPHGWDTILAKDYEMGADLSGGQWQRVALARALMATNAGARVLILDEPTANLDPRAEADIYRRFLDLTRGLTSIVISHRFSTVRQADRICVLSDGQVTELGTHSELMELDGSYAAMFRLQSARFEVPASDDVVSLD